MLSNRGTKSAATQDIPWRFAPGGNNKYDKVTNPTGIVPFGLAENRLVLNELDEFIANVKIPTLAYTYSFSTMGGPRLPIALASHLNDYFSPFSPVLPSQILIGAGLTAVHEMLGLAIGDPGDGILVSRPVYGRFELDFGNTAGLEIVYADMRGQDPFVGEKEVVERFEKGLQEARERGVNVKAVLIVNPHNPLGRCYPASTLKALMAFAQKYQIHLISDEVYGLSVFDSGNPEAPKFTSVLSIDTNGLIDDDLLHILYGFSKDFAAPGLRLGSLITRNKLLQKSLSSTFRFHNPSGASVAIGTAILEDKQFVERFIGLSRERLGEWYKYTTGVLDEAGIEYHKGGNAGFFLYIDLSPWLPAGVEGADEREPEYVLAQRLLDGGVGLHPCEEHNDLPGHFRMVFTQEKDVLSEGLRRLIAILGPRRGVSRD